MEEILFTYRGLTYQSTDGLLVILRGTDGQLVTVPFLGGTPLFEKCVQAHGGNLVLIHSGWQAEEDARAIALALVAFQRILGGEIYVSATQTTVDAD